MKIFSFEKLAVWQEAKELTKVIYTLTSSFPENEKFGLVSQLRRVMISVTSNIAEGSSRTSHKDQARFYQIAYSSLMEVLSKVLIADELGFIENKKVEEIREALSQISYKINALRTAELKNHKPC